LSDTNVNDSVVCITKDFLVIASLVFFRMFYSVWFIERLIESVKMLFLRDEKWIMPALKTNFVYSNKLIINEIIWYIHTKPSAKLNCDVDFSSIPPKQIILKKAIPTEWDDIREKFFPALLRLSNKKFNFRRHVSHNTSFQRSVIAVNIVNIYM